MGIFRENFDLALKYIERRAKDGAQLLHMSY